MITLKCNNCGKFFKVHPSRKTAKFCNIKCYDKHGKNNPKWKGGEVIISGYKYIFSPKHPNKTKLGYVPEHRLIMEKKLKRLLKRHEVVHHINENRLDNRPCNLALSKSTGHHVFDFHVKGRNKKGQFTY